ncbi:hypothetical protein [Burkholderia cepacia]|uniref:hypothetical protein n=1 Tax=Burkholderia cepacia TaxID=292 RepID=UPI0021475B73|nr:hypothetical protein [Burkholderia cepacia]
MKAGVSIPIDEGVAYENGLKLMLIGSTRKLDSLVVMLTIAVIRSGVGGGEAALNAQ